MYHIEPVHVDDGRIYAQLVDLERAAQVADEQSSLLPLVQLLLQANVVLSGWRVFYFVQRKDPLVVIVDQQASAITTAAGLTGRLLHIRWVRDRTGR